MSIAKSIVPCGFEPITLNAATEKRQSIRRKSLILHSEVRRFVLKVNVIYKALVTVGRFLVNSLLKITIYTSEHRSGLSFVDSSKYFENPKPPIYLEKLDN